jgi:plastocyanin
MNAKRLFPALGAAALALALAGCGASSNSAGTTSTTTTTSSTTTPTSTPTGHGGKKLEGTVGPSFDISLTDSSGKAVTTLAAGTYTIVVDDQANIHNFHLTGPGVDKSTDIGGTGKETWTVDLKAGQYHYQCDAHASSMNGDFTVTG